jgi:pentose-5-phosphate-3-epimerase
MKKIQISPSILSADFSQLGNEIKRLEEGGGRYDPCGCDGWSFCS